MFQNQLRKSAKPKRYFFDLRNIQKPKVEYLVNTRLLYQLHKEYDANTAEFKFPFKNIQKNRNDQTYSQCIHKPLSINHQMNDSIGGERIYLERYPSVTTILSNTKPPNEFFSLMNWRKSNIEKFGKEKFGLMQRDTTLKGTTFHQNMKEYFAAESSTNETHHKSHTSGFIKSVCNVLLDISNPLAVESSVVHSSLGYAGTVDLVAEYMGILSVIDWKTSQKKKVNLAQCHSYPIQVSAYAGAINFDPDYPFQILNGVLVIAYENGDPADVHIMNEELCEEYWERWLIRLHEYKALKCRDSVEPQRIRWAIEDQCVSTSLSPDEKGPQEKLSEEAHIIENAQNLKLFVKKQPVLNVKQNGGKSLNQIGRTVKDEEIAATWRNLTGLTESIFGRFFISKGLFFAHYIESAFKASMRKIYNSMDHASKEGKQFHKKE